MDPIPAKPKKARPLKLLLIGIVVCAVLAAPFFGRRSHGPDDSPFLAPVFEVFDYFAPHEYPISCDSPVERDLQSIETMLLTYEVINGAPPSTAQGLEALVTMPVGEPQPPKWKKLMSELPTDPWGHGFGYESPGRRSGKSYDVFSNGKDGIAGNADDIGNWSSETPSAKELSAKETKKN